MFADLLSVGTHCGNDFVRSEEEIQAPTRRGGLTAVSLLSHIPKEEVTRLGELWGDRKLRRSEFIALLLPIVAQSPYFDSRGAKVMREWEKAGWISSACRSVWTHRKKSNAFNVLSRDDRKVSWRDAGRAQKMRLKRLVSDFPTRSHVTDEGLPFSIHDDIDIVNYLHDVFSAVDSAREGSAAWEQFTLFLIDGIVETSLAQTAQQSTEDPASAGFSYVLRGELSSTKAAFGRHELSHEWFSRISYVPSLDKLLCVSKNQVMYIPVSGDPNQRISPIIRHSEEVVAAAYLPEFDVTVMHSVSKESFTIWQHSAKGQPKEVLSMSFSSSYATCVMWDPLQRKIWSGHRNGEVVAATISRDSGGRYSIHRRVVARYGDCITAMEQLPHNGFIATASMDSTVHIIDPTGISREAVLQKHQHGVTTLAFSTTVGVLLTAGFEDEIYVWADNLWSAPVFPLRDLVRPFTGNIIAMCAIPSTSYVAAADTCGVLKLFDLRSRQAVISVAICDSKNFETGLIRRDQLRSENEPIMSLHRREPKMFASMAFTGTLHRQFVMGGSRVFYLSPSAEVAENPRLTYDLETPLVSVMTSDLLGVVTASSEEIIVWSLKTGLPDIRHPRMSAKKISSVVMRPRCDIIAVGHVDGTITIHQASSGLKLQQYNGHDDSVVAMAVHPSRATLVSFSKGEFKLVFWDDTALLATDSVPAVQKFAVRILPTQILYLESTIATVLFSPVNDALLICMQHVMSLYVFNETYNRWLLGARISHGPNSGLEGAQFLPSSGEEQDDEGMTAYLVVIADNRGFLVLWRLDVDHAKVIVEYSLLSIWTNSTILDPVTERRLGPRGSRPQSTMRQRQLLRDAKTSRALSFSLEEDPRLQIAMQRIENASETPPIRCSASDCVYSCWLYTGDDLGRVTVWLLPPFYPPMADQYNRLAPWPQQPEVLTTFSPHSQPIVFMKSCKSPFHCLITFGQDNVVVFSAWHGAELARLQQGPLVDRQWPLARQLRAVKESSVLALVRWCRIKNAIFSGSKSWIPASHEPTPAQTVSATPWQNTPTIETLSVNAPERRVSRAESFDASLNNSWGDFSCSFSHRRSVYVPPRKKRITARMPPRLIAEPRSTSTPVPQVVVGPSAKKLPQPRRPRSDLNLRQPTPEPPKHILFQDDYLTRSPQCGAISPGRRQSPHRLQAGDKEQGSSENPAYSAALYVGSPRKLPSLFKGEAHQTPPFVQMRQRLQHGHLPPTGFGRDSRISETSPRPQPSPRSDDEADDDDDASLHPFSDLDEGLLMRPVHFAERRSRVSIPKLPMRKFKSSRSVHSMLSRKL